MEMQTFEFLRSSFPSADLVLLQGWGEPLLHPELWEMVCQAKAVGAMTGFTTNAKLLDQACALHLVEFGMDVVAIGLAGVTPATHERFRPGCDLAQIDRALTGLRELKRERGVQRQHVHIAFMVLHSNWREVDKLVGLAASWGATQVVVGDLTWLARTRPTACRSRADTATSSWSGEAQRQMAAHFRLQRRRRYRRESWLDGHRRGSVRFGVVVQRLQLRRAQ